MKNRFFIYKDNLMCKSPIDSNFLESSVSNLGDLSSIWLKVKVLKDIEKLVFIKDLSISEKMTLIEYLKIRELKCKEK